MAERLTAECMPRAVASRVGICLLNFAHPGLGLARLGQYRAGLIFAGLAFAIMGSVLAYYAFGPLVTYTSYVILVALAFAAWLALLGSAIGWAIPELHRIAPRLSLAPQAGGLSVQGDF